MKLYYSPGACSLAPHIALREAERRFDLERVDLKTRRTASGRDFTEINPKGYVPCLELTGGETLTEAQVILQYIGDLVPDQGLVPAEDPGAHGKRGAPWQHHDVRRRPSRHLERLPEVHAHRSATFRVGRCERAPIASS